MDKRRWVVYLIRCSDESLYCGTTNDLKNRLAVHNSGKGAKYTRFRRPVELVATSSEMTKSDALKLEYRVKQVPSSEKYLELTKGKIKMTDKNHYRKLEDMYHSAPCNEYYSPKMTVSKGRAEIIIPIRKDFFHAAGATHGSVYFKALDDATFFSVNSLVKDVFVLTSNFNIYLIRPITSGKMKAVGTVISVTRSQFIAEAVLFDSKGKEIARGSGCFVKSKFSLSEEIGYK